MLQETSNENSYNLRHNKIDYSYRMGMERGNDLKGILMNIVSEHLREYVMHTRHLPLTKKKNCIKPHDGFGGKYSYAAQVMLVQMSAKQGIKKFGERAENAIKAEFHQLVRDKEVFIPIKFSELTKDQRKRASKAITLAV